MTSITHSPVEIQTSQQALPSLPSWFGEVALVATFLKNEGVLQAISAQVQLARARMGTYEVIDFVAVLIGYSLSGEPTLEAFFERLLPFASPFMALFERSRLPHRSTLSRFLAAVPPACVAQLRLLFEQDLVARPLPGRQEAGLWDRGGRPWHLFDVDGTRATARQRALPHTRELPSAQRRFDEVCAKGYAGRKRGEVVRTRTVVKLASTHHWLGTFAGAGNGDYQEELKEALQVILASVSALGLDHLRSIVRLDGLSGTGALVALLVKAAFGWIMRGKDYGLLTQQGVKARLKLPPDQETRHPETGTFRQLFDFPELLLDAHGTRSRVVVARHPATTPKSAVGKSIEGVVYDLFFTSLPQDGFRPADVLSVYFGRGGEDPVLADEDQEQDPDRCCSHTPAGQTFWQILSQWMWNLRLELGKLVQQSPLRTTKLAPAQLAEASGEGEPALPEGVSALALGQPVSFEDRLRLAGYGPPTLARPLHPGLSGAQDFLPQADGTLLCPAQVPLRVRARREEANGTLRVYSSASPKRCQSGDLRAACLREGTQSRSPRHVSLLYQPDAQQTRAVFPARHRGPPVAVGALPLLYRDWERCGIRREWIKWLRSQTVILTVLAAPAEASREPPAGSPLLTAAQRKHWRLS